MILNMRRGKNMKYANHSNLNAIDHLGRALPSYESVKIKDNTKIVGLFYYLWHGYFGTHGPYDISKILEADPEAMDHLDSPMWPDSTNAPLMHWSEPLFGYYLSDDEWVLRRHVQMFIDAQIDVLYFDVTNNFTFRNNYFKLFEVLRDLQNQGFRVPKVCFYLAPETRGCGTGGLESLWLDLYEPGYYSDLWFYWKGKPLIICHSKRSLPDKIREFFTWRAPTWRDPKVPECWAWEGNPPKMAIDNDGNAEQMAISVCANHCDLERDDPRFGENMSDGHWGMQVHGRSWHNGARDMRENASHYGFHIQEQMDTVLRENPPVVFVCQWNEWLVPFLTPYTAHVPAYDYHGHEICFRDEFNEEYSRDIEPIKGGYRDAYYMQLISFIRQYKGMDEPVSDNEMHSINIMGDFSQWQDNGITYRKYVGGCKARDHQAYDSIGRYTNDTGRNEIDFVKVMSDDGNLYFYVHCTTEITRAEGKNWMNLYIRNPKSNAPAWEGYHYLLNRSRTSDKMTLERCVETGKYTWERIADVDYRVSGDSLHIKVPKTLIDVNGSSYCVEFKWSDNRQDEDVMDFYINGESAPMGRLNYVYYFDEITS